MGSLDDIDTRLPPGAWDSHVHVVDEDKFPLHPLHPYRPRKADLNDLLAFEQGLGIAHSCLVAFSVYHTDNSSILDGLRRLGGKGRAVVCIDENTTDRELQELHDAGARAVRVNLKTRGQRMEKAELRKVLQSSARRVSPYGWAIQVYVSLDQVALLAEIIPELDGVAVVIDHLGHPDPAAGPVQQQPGYREMIELLRSGRAYTKLSGTYRFEALVGLDEYVREVLAVAPDQVVWASDWPHSGGVSANPGGNKDVVQEYRKIDDLGWMRRCQNWCREVGGDRSRELERKIWVDNPRRLWRYDGDD